MSQSSGKAKTGAEVLWSFHEVAFLNLDYKKVLSLNEQTVASRKLHSLLAQTSVLVDITDVSRGVSTLQCWNRKQWTEKKTG